MDNTANGEDFPIMEQLFRETKRVLRPKGIMVVVNFLPQTGRKAIWFNQIHESLTERWLKLFPTIQQYEAMFENCGFQSFSKLNILGVDMIKNYYDPEGPLKKEWRAASSYWGFATEKEILEIEKKVRKMNEEGTISEFIRKYDTVSETGGLTIIACKSM